LDIKNKCISDVANLDCTGKNLELVHEIAFRNGLGNSLYCKEGKLGSFGGDQLLAYVQQTHVGSGVTVVGTNCDHAELVDLVQGLDIQGGDVEAPAAQKYHGGQTHSYTCGGVSNLGHAAAHVTDAPVWALVNNLAYTNGGVAHASLVGSGAALGSESAPAFAVLGNILGGPALVPWGSKSAASTSVLNLSYSDAGLFGVHVSGGALGAADALKAAREAAMSVTAEDVAAAKATVRASVAIALSEAEGQVESLLSQVALTGGYVAPAAVLKSIDEVTVEAVQAAAQQAFGGAATLVVTGDTTYAPYLDEL